MTRLLVSFEPGGRKGFAGTLALVGTDPPSLYAIRSLPPAPEWPDGCARGLARLPDGGLLVAADRHVLELNASTLRLRRVFAHPTFDDLHGLCVVDERILVVSTGRAMVLSLDPVAGVSHEWLTIPPVHVHPNTMTRAPDGRLLLTVHGRRTNGMVCEVVSGVIKPSWTHQDGAPLREPHDGRILDGNLVANESFMGRIAWRNGRSVPLGGWCRGLWAEEDLLVAGVAPFREPWPRGESLSPHLAFVRDGVVFHRLFFGLEPPLQPFAILPARSGDLGVTWDDAPSADPIPPPRGP